MYVYERMQRIHSSVLRAVCGSLPAPHALLVGETDQNQPRVCCKSHAAWNSNQKKICAARISDGVMVGPTSTKAHVMSPKHKYHVFLHRLALFFLRACFAIVSVRSPRSSVLDDRTGCQAHP